MKTDQTPKTTAAVFLQMVSLAVARLKQRLQQDYERVYPNLREVIHLVLDQEETNAWRLSNFPHLLFADLVEAHFTNLNLQLAETKHDEVLVPHGLHGFISFQPALASCGS